MRLDVFLVSDGHCATRSEAQRAISDSRVTVNGRVVTKCAYEIADGESVAVADGGCPYVSRGGEKLRGALEHFHINVAGVHALDIGASTGGFTDCLLQYGAARVYALENGSGQLHPRLLTDARVISMEHTNARYMTKELFGTPIRFACMDVSFISQKLILPAVVAVLEQGGALVTLIKPQFEVGRANVGKGGIVKDPKARARAVEDICGLASTLGLRLVGTMESPIRGGDGNTEYLAYFVKQEGT